MKRFVYITSLALLTAFILNGCTGDIKGPERQNVPPEVQFVNIPVSGAKFSTDTTIYWYGTDVDGFIVQYRYAVVRAMDINEAPDIEAYLARVDVDNDLPWVRLGVGLNDPHTNERIPMSADISDPVRTYVESYVFLQAIDNLGAKSRIIYRSYLKNNHFPNTLISARDVGDPYVNAKYIGGLLDGVSIGWSGEDPIDYPRNPPPFEFQWKLFGPFDTCQLAEVNATCIRDVFLDNYGDFYYSGDSLPVPLQPDTMVDTTAVPETLIVIYDTLWALVDTLPRGNPYGSWQEEFDLSILEDLSFYSCDSNESTPGYTVVDSSYDALNGNSWVYDVREDIIDVYRDKDVDTTSLYYFLFWCQARDDSRVPDPVAAFQWVSAIEPKYERDVIIIDVTSYKSSQAQFWNWPKFPQQSGIGIPSDTPYVKHIFGKMINEWSMENGRGDDVFDIYGVMENIQYGPPCNNYIQYEKYRATQDYFPTDKLARCESYGIYSVTLRDILKHKVVLLIKDMPGATLRMNHAITLSILDGLRAGMSCWSMVRSPFKDFVLSSVREGTYQDVPASYQAFFGIENMWHTSWMGIINYHLDTSGWRIEDFVGAEVLPEFSPQLPTLPVDTFLLEDRYLWIPGPAGFNIYDYRCHLTGEILVGALPEVGYVEKYPAAEAMYLYQSKYGKDSPKMVENCARQVGRFNRYDGSVVAVKLDAGAFRTSHFSFSLLPIQEDSAKVAFNTMMNWLYEPFMIGGMAGKRAIETPKVDVERIKQITRELHELKALGLLETNDDFSDE